MFSVLFTFTRKGDSVHVIVQVHEFTGRLFLKVLKQRWVSWAPAAGKTETTLHPARQWVYRMTQQLLSPVFSRFRWPWEFGSGNVSLATKCITVVLPKGSFNAMWKVEDNVLHIHQPTEITDQNGNHFKHGRLSEGLSQQRPSSWREPLLQNEIRLVLSETIFYDDFFLSC